MDFVISFFIGIDIINKNAVFWRIKMKFEKVFDFILKIIIILLGILVIIWALQLLFGGSPTLEEFNFALIILFGGIMLHLYREAGVMKNDCKNNFLNIKNSFSSIKEDMDELKKDMGLIKRRLNIK